MGVVVVLLMLVLLDQLVLSPLSRMTERVVDLGRRDDLSVRLDSQRSDELERLALTFDRTADQRAEARRRLSDQSFAAGVAEHASGVMHNLRNTMTPTQSPAAPSLLRRY
jgi:nitrate/nitrite-specific signal transduction histidine kinase